jgi:hypothetical protein
MKKTLISALFVLAVIAAVLIPALPVGAQVVPPDPNTAVGIDATVKDGIRPYLTDLIVSEANTGNVVLTNIWVWVNNTDSSFTANCTRINYYVSGDSNNDSKLDVGETWHWTIPNVTVNSSTDFTATGHGIFTQITKAGKISKDITYNPSTGAYPLEQMSVGVNAQEPPAALGDYVWYDLNNNGIQDPGEPGASGVLVELLYGDGSPVLDLSNNPITMTTNATGRYLFENLVPDLYYSVRFTAPDGFYFTLQDQLANDAVDSDADPSTGQTIATELTPGETDLTWDAGLVGVHVGDSASKGFWTNPNGQKIIKGITGNMAAWLANNYPYIYGVNAPPAMKLVGKTNNDVAALMITLKNVQAEGQILAAAIATYVTQIAYATPLVYSFNFNVTTLGMGENYYYVGSYGSKIGLEDNHWYTVNELLDQVNFLRSKGSGVDGYNSTAKSACETIFESINKSGHIT